MTSARTVSRLSRILALIPYVLEREAVDIDDVLERFGYTPEQLSRDLDTVFVCGLPGYGPGELMEAYIDEDEVIIDAADYFTRAPRLTPAEALGLLAAGMTLLGMGEEAPALKSAVRKLTEVVMPDSGGSLSVGLEDTELGSVLREAAARGEVVTIHYRSVGKEETTVRDIEPWTVFNTLGRWYVTGHCRMVDGERTFRIDRIRSATPTGELFDRPKRVPEPGVGYAPAEGDISCVISLGPSARWVPEYYPVEVIEDTTEALVVRFWAPDPEVAARLLIRLGDSGRLVEGEEVAERLKALGRQMLAIYR